jgi:hypothetical protein
MFIYLHEESTHEISYMLLMVGVVFLYLFSVAILLWRAWINLLLKLTYVCPIFL